MGFRLRRSARLGPLRFNFSKGGLSSISVGGRGASFNIPVNRSGGPRTTVGLPGTGLSWSVEHTPSEGLPNTRRLRPGQLDVLKQSLLGVLRQELFAPGSTGEQLWEHGLVSRLLADGSLGARTTGLLALIETPGPALHHRRAGSLQAGLCTWLAHLTLQEQVPAGPVPRIRPHLRSRLSRPRMEMERKRYPRMREVVFRVLAERPGHLEAQAVGAAFSAGLSLPIHITAPTLEELQHEAREALIELMGPAHGTVRVRVRPKALCP